MKLKEETDMFLTTSFLLMAGINIINYQQSNVNLEVFNVNKSSNQFSFEYKLTNNSEKPIWVCRDSDSKSQIKYTILIDAEKALIQQKSIKVPDSIFLEEPIWGEYVKIEKKGNYKDKISLNLPLNEMNPFKSKKPSSSEAFIVKRLIFEMGVFKEDLIKLKPDLQDGSSKNIAYISCFWVEKHPEELLSVEIDNVSLPCIIKR